MYVDSPGSRGLVLKTFGAGNALGDLDSAMTNITFEAVTRGIVIVNVTQCKCIKKDCCCMGIDQKSRHDR